MPPGKGRFYASFHPPVDWSAEALIKDRVLQEARPTVLLDPGLIQVSSEGTTGGLEVTVDVEYPFSAVSIFIGSFFPSNPFFLKATTVMVVRE